MPRYLYVSCCAREEHAINRSEEGFEEELKSSLGEFRLNTKKLLFLKNHRFNWTRHLLCRYWTRTVRTCGSKTLCILSSTGMNSWWTCRTRLRTPTSWLNDAITATTSEDVEDEAAETAEAEMAEEEAIEEVRRRGEGLPLALETLPRWCQPNYTILIAFIHDIVL
jgi:hypothetical protein